MKKLTAVFILITLILTSCSSTLQLNITNISKIEIMSRGITVEVTDTENIKYITDNINSMKFSQGDSSVNCKGWSYQLKYYNFEGNLIEEIIIMDEYTIDYKDYYYHGMDVDNEIDTVFLDSLLGI